MCLINEPVSCLRGKEDWGITHEPRDNLPSCSGIVMNSMGLRVVSVGNLKMLLLDKAANVKEKGEKRAKICISLAYFFSLREL